MSPIRVSLSSCLFLGALAAACGGSRLEAEAGSGFSETSFPTATEPGLAPMESVSTPITQIERTDVVATVDAGLGRFLQKFEMEPSLTERGEFSGFRIVRVLDDRTFQGLGIGPGDVVTSINQRPIERPTEAYEVFVSLKTAETLEVDYLRGGRPMRLSLPIIGKAELATAAPEQKKAPQSNSAESSPKGVPVSPETKKQNQLK